MQFCFAFRKQVSTRDPRAWPLPGPPAGDPCQPQPDHLRQAPAPARCSHSCTRDRHRGWEMTYTGHVKCTACTHRWLRPPGPWTRMRTPCPRLPPGQRTQACVLLVPGQRCQNRSSRKGPPQHPLLILKISTSGPSADC